MKKEFLWNQVQEEEVSSLELVVDFGICQKKRERVLVFGLWKSGREKELWYLELESIRERERVLREIFCVYPRKRKQDYKEEPRLQEKPKL